MDTETSFDRSGLTNEGPMSTLENEKSFEEHMREDFNRAKLDGILPEGVRDEQDYADYMEEQGARALEAKQAYDEHTAEIEKRRAEKLRESYEFLGAFGYKKEFVDSLIYETDYEVCQARIIIIT